MRKRTFLLQWLFFLGVATTAVLGQSLAERQFAAEKLSLCDLAQHPEQYNGKLVEIHASVTGTDLSIDDFEQNPACASWIGVLIVLPGQVTPKPTFDVIRDAAFNRLFAALHNGMNVQATFSGQFDAVYTWKNHKQVWIGGREARGFGKNGKYGGRIVLHRISEVLARPVPRK